MSKVIDVTREEVNARFGDIISHLEQVTKDSIELSRKITEGGFRVAKEVHSDMENRRKEDLEKN